MNIEAGLDLAKLLKDQFAYEKSILCYTGGKFLEANRQKFLKNKVNVYATAKRSDADGWATFKQTR